MPAPEYADFEIHIRRDSGDGLNPVSVRVPSKDLRAEGTLRLPYGDAEVSRSLAWMEQGRLDTPQVKQFGAGLFEALFQGAIKEVYDGSRQSNGARLRYRLICDAPAVARIPWEFLYDPARSSFLALKPLSCAASAQPSPHARSRSLPRCASWSSMPFPQECSRSRTRSRRAASRTPWPI